LTFASMNGLVSPRLLIMTGFQVLWGLRLTWNYWRKGGYQKGSEDYRWIYVRKLIHRYVPTSLQSVSLIVFNIVFISFIQNILLFLLTAPNYLVMLIGYETPLNYQDVLCMTALVASISLETLADEQQWTYQNAKHAKPSEPSRAQAKNISASVSYCEPEDLKRGFITGGLFRYSRHPNFACEQANWYFFYAFGCIATRTGWNWTAIGPLSLTFVIFVGSTILTEWITAQKYPDYRIYQKKVGRFIPLPGYFWPENDGPEAKKSR